MTGSIIGGARVPNAPQPARGVPRRSRGGPPRGRVNACRANGPSISTPTWARRPRRAGSTWSARCSRWSPPRSSPAAGTSATTSPWPRRVAAALEHSVRIGAHPSYPDREGFGRRPMAIDRDELRRLAERAAAGPGPGGRRGRHGHRVGQGARGALRGGRQGRRRSTRPFATSCARPVARARRSCCPRAAAPWPWCSATGWWREEEGFCDRAYRPDGGLVDRAGRRRVSCRLRRGGRAGAEPGQGRRGRRRRQRAHAVGGHAVHPRRLPRGSGHGDRGPSGHGGSGDRRGRASACMTPLRPRRGGAAPR